MNRTEMTHAAHKACKAECGSDIGYWCCSNYIHALLADQAFWETIETLTDPKRASVGRVKDEKAIATAHKRYLEIGGQVTPLEQFSEWVWMMRRSEGLRKIFLEGTLGG